MKTPTHGEASPTSFLNPTRVKILARRRTLRKHMLLAGAITFILISGAEFVSITRDNRLLEQRLANYSQHPPWLARLIVQFEDAPASIPPRSIWQYRYKEKTVYYIPGGCCDQFSTLLDSLGNRLCSPDGGFAGAGDRRCPDFFRERENEVLIWRELHIR